jgi:biopolymer transport protein TolQ
MTHAPFLASLGAAEIIDLLRKSSFLGVLDVVVLVLLSVLCWAVMFDRGRLLAAVRRGHVEFWEQCHAWLQGRLDRRDLEAWCRGHPDLPLANLWRETSSQPTSQAVRRSAERVAYAETENLERYLIILSTTVTVAPFLGLLGTVWGLMQAFWEMSVLRSANLTVVAPGIAEALITTIAGLSAAVPAVVFFNLFVRKIDLVGNEMERLRSIMEDAAPSAGEAKLGQVRRPETHEKEQIR